VPQHHNFTIADRGGNRLHHRQAWIGKIRESPPPSSAVLPSTTTRTGRYGPQLRGEAQPVPVHGDHDPLAPVPQVEAHAPERASGPEPEHQGVGDAVPVDHGGVDPAADTDPPAPPVGHKRGLQAGQVRAVHRDQAALHDAQHAPPQAGEPHPPRQQAAAQVQFTSLVGAASAPEHRKPPSSIAASKGSQLGTLTISRVVSASRWDSRAGSKPSDTSGHGSARPLEFASPATAVDADDETETTTPRGDDSGDGVLDHRHPGGENIEPSRRLDKAGRSGRAARLSRCRATTTSNAPGRPAALSGP
jgi:hypothetical protein